MVVNQLSAALFALTPFGRRSQNLNQKNRDDERLFVMLPSGEIVTARVLWVSEMGIVLL
jgi:hypothetical protein